MLVIVTRLYYGREEMLVSSLVTYGYNYFILNQETS